MKWQEQINPEQNEYSPVPFSNLMRDKANLEE